MRPDDIPAHARPHGAAWAFLLDRWDSGLFVVARQGDGSYAARFADGGELIPFADMAYNSAIGLYRPSAFPDEATE